MFEDYIAEQMKRVKTCSYAGLFTQTVEEKFESRLRALTELITSSSAKKLIADEVSQDNLYDAMMPELMPREQRRKVEEAILKKIRAGTLSFPEPLINILTLRLKNVTDAFLEMLCRMNQYKKEISSTLLGEKTYTKINDIELSAGDTHNHGRSVAILHTDAGILVYKPHDMRGDEYIYKLAERFFPEFIGIPKCIAFGDSFGVCEFIEKQRFEGEDNARSFWYKMGGMTAFFKILGSTDMHYENISCHGGKPYILDTETIITPIKSNEIANIRNPELEVLWYRSPYSTCVLPAKLKETEISPLINTDESGIAPLVDGEKVTVFSYLNRYLEGYHEVYWRAIACREELADAIRNLPPQMPVRVIVRGTQNYFETMQRLYHHSSLASKESNEKSEDLLHKLLLKQSLPKFKKVVEKEFEQIKQGDIPYVYTTAESHSLFADGLEVEKEVFEKSGIEHALDNLYAMSEADELFDKTLLEQSIKQYPMQFSKDNQILQKKPVRSSVSLSKEKAFAESKKLLESMYELKISSTFGKPFWGFSDSTTSSFKFCDEGLFYGLSGMATFSAAVSYVSGDEKSKEISEIITNEMIICLRRFYAYQEHVNFSFDYAPLLGESDGIAGIVIALSLLKKYSSKKSIDELCTSIIELLHKVDLQRYVASDRVLGIAGLLSAMCRFQEFNCEKEIIRTLAERLLSLKTLEYNGKFLWKTFPNADRPISGAGHGLIGIAEALFAATKILGDEKYAEASKDALDFECKIYEKYQPKFGTWADLRSFPPNGHMHGYCSGAPGIGIMIEHIKGMGFTNEAIEKLFGYAKNSVDTIPLNERDHLCCGNSAVAEYYLTVGKHEEAGKVLGAMYERSVSEGSYRYFAYNTNNAQSSSLFYGMGGIGYEMLRYAFPEKIMSIL